MVYAHIQRAVVLFRYVGAAGVPRRGPLQDQGDDLLWVVRVLQPPVDGVGETHDFLGGLVGCPHWPLLLRRLADDLIQQGFVPQGDDSAALDAFQVQGIAPAVPAAHPLEGYAAGGTAQAAYQLEGWPLCFGRLLCRFLPDAALNTVECFAVQNGRIALLSDVTGVLQQSLDPVLVPCRRFLAEGDILLIQQVGQLLIGQAVQVKARHTLDHIDFLRHQGQFSVFDLIAIEKFSLTHRFALPTFSASSIPPWSRNRMRVWLSATIPSTNSSNRTSSKASNRSGPAFMVSAV